jgi:hypothetical protein
MQPSLVARQPCLVFSSINNSEEALQLAKDFHTHLIVPNFDDDETEPFEEWLMMLGDIVSGARVS